jgi:hypothetical protein
MHAFLLDPVSRSQRRVLVDVVIGSGIGESIAEVVSHSEQLE